MTDGSVGFWCMLRDHRNNLLDESDKYVTSDYNHLSDEEKQKWIKYRNALRDMPSYISNEIAIKGGIHKIAWPIRPDGKINTTYPIRNGSTKLWVTNENGNLEIGDSLVASNVFGYFTKGSPTVMTIEDVCDFSASTTETYYSNIVSVTQKDEVSYWTSNTVSHYVGNVVSHYSNIVVYDGVNVYSNVEIGEYSKLTTEDQSNFTAIMKSNISSIEIEGYTPIISYSNINSDQYDANIHTDYVKIIESPASNVVEYSNITAEAYESLDTAHIISPAYTLFFHELSNTSIRVQEYAELTPKQRTEYTIQSVPAVTSNLQSFYTPQTKTTLNELRYLDASGVLTDQANAVHIAAFVGCTYHCG